MAIAVPDLFALSILLLALGMVSAASGIVQLLNWFIRNTVGKVPLIGGYLDAPFDAALQAISNYLGGVASQYESYIGWVFHNLASEVEWIGRELAGLGLLIDSTAEHLATAAVRDVTHTITNEVTTTATKVIDHTVTDVHTITQVADTAATEAIATLTAQVGALERDARLVYEPSIEALRERAREIEDAYSRVWKLIEQHSEALGIGAVVSAFAIAASEWGASWLLCDAAAAAGGALCGLGAEFIEALLGAAFLAFGAGDLCQILSAATGLVDEFQPALSAMLGALDDLLVCQGADLPPALPVAALTLPPAQAASALPVAA